MLGRANGLEGEWGFGVHAPGASSREPLGTTPSMATGFRLTLTDSVVVPTPTESVRTESSRRRGFEGHARFRARSETRPTPTLPAAVQNT